MACDRAWPRETCSPGSRASAPACAAMMLHSRPGCTAHSLPRRPHVLKSRLRGPTACAQSMQPATRLPARLQARTVAQRGVCRCAASRSILRQHLCTVARDCSRLWRLLMAGPKPGTSLLCTHNVSAAAGLALAEAWDASWCRSHPSVDVQPHAAGLCWCLRLASYHQRLQRWCVHALHMSWALQQSFAFT